MSLDLPIDREQRLDVTIETEALGRGGARRPNASRAPRSANNANDGARERVPRDELAVRLMADEATINAAMRRQRWQSSDLRKRQRTAGIDQEAYDSNSAESKERAGRRLH